MLLNFHFITNFLAKIKQFVLAQFSGKLIVLLILFAVLLIGDRPLAAQMLPGLGLAEGEVISRPYVPTFRSGNLEIAPVFLDGNIIATVSASVSLNNQNRDDQQTSYEAATRSYLIHSKSQKILANMNDYSRRVLAKQGITNIDAQVHVLKQQLTVEIVNLNNTIAVMTTFPRDDVPEVIYTVTQAEIERPRIVSSQPEKIAQRAADGVKKFLIEAWKARQTPNLLVQAQRGLQIFVSLCLMSFVLLLLQKFLASRRDKFDQGLAVAESSSITSEPQAMAITDQQVNGFRGISYQLQKLSLRQRKSLNALYRSLFFWSQWLLWLLGISYISSLFYFSRPLSNWIIGISIRGYRAEEEFIMNWPPLDWLMTLGGEATLGTPLLILFLLLITRLTIKTGDALSDFWVERWSHQKSSQRDSLRAPTLAVAFKGWLRAIVYLTLGVIAAHHLQQLGTITQAVAVILGFLSFAISLASQNLLKDLIAGLLILWEDQYAVGDVITIGDQGGLVERLTLRITQLRNLDGELITIPNGTIEMVKNLSSEWSRVNYAVEVNYDADVETVIEVMAAIANGMYQEAEWQNLILEPPEILGVDNISHTGILIRLLIKTQPLQQWPVAREYRLRLKNAFDQQGIAIGIPKQNVYLNDSLLPSGVLKTA